ncbi:MAG: selenide, water dikinase SelD [Bacteroidota bacterium]
MEEIKLTQFSHGAGCGCKIAPDMLEKILRSEASLPDSRLLVGYATSDDAAVYDLGNGQALISTTDFFLPIVNDAFDFGRIASANAISDVYAMGGKPLMAVAILGWPVETISPELARQVLDGARQVCKDAGIPLAGGHSINSKEPIFGLAVTGVVPKENIKANDTIREGDLLYLTKPLGIGIMTTAHKRGLLAEWDYKNVVDVMCTLNKAGEELGKHREVHAMTDVTGFGLAGHLLEMTGKSELAAEIELGKVPKLPNLEQYTNQFIFPDNTTRIYNSCKNRIKWKSELDFLLLCDPQTSGGLLVAAGSGFEKKLMEIFKGFGVSCSAIGQIKKRTAYNIIIR